MYFSELQTTRVSVSVYNIQVILLPDTAVAEVTWWAVEQMAEEEERSGIVDKQYWSYRTTRCLILLTEKMALITQHCCLHLH